MRKANTLLAEVEADELWQNAYQIGDVRLIRHTVNSDDPKTLKQLLSRMTDQPNTVAVLGHSGQRPRWMTGRSASLALDLKQLLPTVQVIPGARGGGSPQLIQGGAPDTATLEAVMNVLESSITTLLKNSN